MLMSRRGSVRAGSALKVEWFIGALVAASIGLSSAAHAASFGHSRIVSGVGQPLHIEIPVTELTEQEIQTLRARPAPAQAWRDAGMTPPVALESMRLALLDGHRPGTKIIQLRSDQPFSQPIVDLLLDVQSASGQQRYQVSLVASVDTTAVRLAVEQGIGNLDGAAAIGAPAGSDIAGKQIRVRQRDTMFAVAERNAVRGVTVYQMMMGLQRANPKAFIENNVNLVRADAVLTMPDLETLTALSDREARRLFLQHVQAFNEYRRRGSGAAAVAMTTSGAAVAQGDLSLEADELQQGEQAAPSAPEDRLRLSATPNRNGSRASDGNRPQSGNLLASSGVIATDAMPDRGPQAATSDGGGRSGFSSGVAPGGTALQADGAGFTDPDDEAAVRKGMVESRSRIIELEDNVRHLNEALQKQGHVAAETALEGVREVGEVIKEIIKLVEPEAENLAGAGAANGSSTEAAAGSGPGSAGRASLADQPAGGNGGAAGMDAPGGGPDTAGETGDGSGAGSTSTAAGTDGIAGTSSNAGTTGNSGTTGSDGGAPGTTDDAGRTSGTSGASGAASSGETGGTSGSGGTAAGASAADGSPANGASDSLTGGSAALPAAAVTGSSASAPAASSSAVDRSTGVAESEAERSWFWDNIIAIIGAGLAFIVMLVVWLLRRGSRPGDDVFESDSPITDTMVREKLRDIDLDLNDSSEPGRSRR